MYNEYALIIVARRAQFYKLAPEKECGQVKHYSTRAAHKHWIIYNNCKSSSLNLRTRARELGSLYSNEVRAPMALRGHLELAYFRLNSARALRKMQLYYACAGRAIFCLWLCPVFMRPSEWARYRRHLLVIWGARVRIRPPLLGLLRAPSRAEWRVGLARGLSWPLLD